jgi:hypothetical protein
MRYFAKLYRVLQSPDYMILTHDIVKCLRPVLSIKGNVRHLIRPCDIVGSLFCFAATL